MLPAARALLTSLAVTSGTANRSGSGGSCLSGLDTPACSTTGVTVIPLLISLTSSRAVMGRPALGISALPGQRAYTVWKSLIG